MMKIAPCRCGNTHLEVDSNRNANASWIQCGDCDFRMQEACDEETLVERWNAAYQGQEGDHARD